VTESSEGQFQNFAIVNFREILKLFLEISRYGVIVQKVPICIRIEWTWNFAIFRNMVRNFAKIRVYPSPE
jgi:hypothetical protein